MTKNQINELLQAQHGASIVPGFNYAIFSVRTNKPDEVAKLIRDNKASLDTAIGLPLLPFVCYTRKKSVIVPVPFDASLNLLGDALAPVLTGTDAQIPSWS